MATSVAEKLQETDSIHWGSAGFLLLVCRFGTVVRLSMGCDTGNRSFVASDWYAWVWYHFRFAVFFDVHFHLQFEA